MQLAQTFGNPLRLERLVAYPNVLDGGIEPVPFTEEKVQWLLDKAENNLKVPQAILESRGLRVEIERTLEFPPPAWRRVYTNTTLGWW